MCLNTDRNHKEIYRETCHNIHENVEKLGRWKNSTQIILASLEAHSLLLNFIIYLLSSVWKLQIEGAAYGYVKCVLDENAAPWDCSLIP